MKLHSTIAALTLGTLILTASGCGTYGSLSPLGFGSPTSATALKSEPTTKEEFVKAVASRGIKLTSQQLALISTGRSVQPDGTFASRPANNLTAEQNLEVHFKKHAREFKPAIPSAEEYLKRAMDLAAGKRGKIVYYFDTTSFSKGYQSQVVRWNPQTKEMTALRPDGAVTTYYLNFSLKPNRFVVVPQF